MRHVATTLVLLGLLTAATAPAAARGGRVYECLNGVTAVLHTADELAAGNLALDGGRAYLDHPNGERVELATGPDDPRLSRVTDRFHPFDASQVLDALAGMAPVPAGVRVEVFVLPLPPVDGRGSYARDGAIYLAPGYGPVAETTIHYIVTHEMGHVLTEAFVDGSPERWSAYAELRGLPPVGPRGELLSGATVPHRDRPREILAEDIRHLCGGHLARSSGTIENASLPRPDAVVGLPELVASFLRSRPLTASRTVPSRAFPNPCNPRTHVEMDLLDEQATAGGQAELRLFDVRGRLVRVVAGGETLSGRLRVTWDGCEEGGGPAASGTYLYVLTLGRLVSRGSVALVR